MNPTKGKWNMGDSKRRRGDGPTIDALTNFAFQRARNALIMGARERPLLPTWLAVMPDGRIHESTTEFYGEDMRASDLHKETVARAKRSWMRTNGVTAYAFISEAWMSPNDNEQRRPSEREDHVEVVVALAENSDGEARNGVWRIVRGETGRAIKLEPIEGIADYNKPESGRFSGLLLPGDMNDDDDPRTTFTAPATDLEELKTKGPPVLDERTAREVAMLEAGSGMSADANMRRVVAAYHGLVADMITHSYRCLRCRELKFKPGDKPAFVAFRIPWPSPEFNNVRIWPLCQDCAPKAAPFSVAQVSEKENGR
jgi:hypothetical protein